MQGRKRSNENTLDREITITKQARGSVTTGNTSNKLNSMGWTIARWNIRKLSGKERELQQKFDRMNVDISHITQKERRKYDTNNKHKPKSGVSNMEKARCRMCYIMGKNTKARQNVSESILKIELKIEGREEINGIAAFSSSSPILGIHGGK